MDILTILILLIHEHGISFYLFVSSSICFVIQFSVYRSFTSSVKVILTLFIVIDAIVNSMAIFLYFSDIY